jgi:transglutaminase-like putative cysteine protease
MQRLKIVHRTYYNFSGAVHLQPHRLLLRPRTGSELRIESSSLDITPTATLRWQRDAHDNAVAIASFATPTTQLAILSEVIVQHYDEAPLDFLVADHAVHYPFAYDAEESVVLQPYLQSSAPHADAALDSWVGRVWHPGEAVQTYALLQRLCTGINQSLAYQSREEPGVQPVAETLARGTGSCRDFAQLFMAATRTLGLAARFVSGYLHAPNSSYDFGATHAWSEVYLPGAGWKGFDPTIGEMASNKHIAVAVARRPDAVPPVAGSFFGPPGASLQVGVWVTAL